MNGDLMRREMDEQPEVLRRIADSAAETQARCGRSCPNISPALPWSDAGVGQAAVLGRYATELAAHRPAGLTAPSLHTRYTCRSTTAGTSLSG